MSRFDFEWSRKGQRKIDVFTGSQMLLDYHLGRLDEERKKALEKLIQVHPEFKNELSRLKSGIQYLSKLNKVELDPEKIKDFSEPINYFDQALKKMKFEKWPVGVKMGLETVLVASLITLAIAFIPWNVLKDLILKQSDQVILAEVDRSLKNTQEGPSELESEDKTFDEGAATTTLPAIAAQTTIVTTTTSTTKLVAVSTSTTIPAGVPMAPAVVAGVPKPAPEKRVGMLYRGSLSAVNLPAITPKIVERLSSLGGRKAGEVVLGWERPDGSRYFHFTLPESKLVEVEALFQEYGVMSLGKERHDKVMPDGIIRLIITMEAKKQ